MQQRDVFKGKQHEQAAYYGTPHQFDTFPTDKIGTGERDQADIASQ